MDKKKKKYIYMSLIAVSIVILTIGLLSLFKATSTLDKHNVKYEILDESVVDKTPHIEEWKVANEVNQGTYSTSDAEKTYILISAGEVKAANKGVALLNVEKSLKKVEIEYGMTKGDGTECEPYIPSMLISFDRTDKKIEFKKIDVPY